MCSVGDMKNNLRILQTEARQMKYNEEFDLDGLTKGNPQSLLPLYNHLFTSFNPTFSNDVMNILDDTLSVKSDVRFMESVYKILRDMFNFKPAMTKEQFFTLNNFAERKIIMCIEVMRLVQDRCRFLGPRNPTNPNIKVTSVVDTGRSGKKSSHDLVTVEPSSDSTVNRKVSEKCRKPVSALMGMTEKDGWQVKLGYLRPKSPGSAGEETGVKMVKPMKDEGTEKRIMASATSPPLQYYKRSDRVDMMHIPLQKAESGHMYVGDIQPRSPDRSQNDWDPTGAVECILAKVRDLPTQLTTFMKAVESRLQKIEERLDCVEAMATQNAHMEGRPPFPDDVKREMSTIQAKLLLIENRLTLMESKASNPASQVHTKTDLSQEEKKTEFVPSPFVSLERGEDPFSQSLVQTFSPIRQDGSSFGLDINTTITSIADTDDRRSSTPNQSSSANLLPSKGSSRMEEGNPAAADDLTSSNFHNLDMSTQQQVERIKNLFKATHSLFPNGATVDSMNT